MGKPKYLISSRSVKIDTGKLHVSLIGFQIYREEFHGINDRSYYPVWQILSEKSELLSLRITKEKIILILGKFVDQVSDRFVGSVERILQDQLPHDCRFTYISGYELPITGLINLSGCPNEYFVFKELTLGSHSLSLVKGLLGFPGTTLILGTIMTDKTKIASLLIEKDVSDDLDSNEPIYSFLQNLPDCQGQLEQLKKSYVSKNRGLCSLGIMEAENIDGLTMKKILVDLKNVTSVHSKPNPPQVEPPITQTPINDQVTINDDVQKTNGTTLAPLPSVIPGLGKAGDSPSRSEYFDILDHLKSLLSHYLVEHGWIITEEEVINQHQCYVRIANELMVLSIFLIYEYSNLPEQLICMSEQEELTPVVFGDHPPPVEWKQGIEANYYNISDLDQYLAFSMI